VTDGELKPDFLPAFALIETNPGFANFQQQISGNTILHAAAAGGDLEIARRLMKDLGADPRVKNKEGKAPGDFVATENAAMQKLLGAAVAFNEKVGDVAANGGYKLSVIKDLVLLGESLVDVGLGLSIATVEGGYTILHALCRTRVPKYIDVTPYFQLIGAGADPLAKDAMNRVPLDLAKEEFREATRRVASENTASRKRPLECSPGEDTQGGKRQRGYGEEQEQEGVQAAKQQQLHGEQLEFRQGFQPDFQPDFQSFCFRGGGGGGYDRMDRF
jgi:hypothetical protein